MKKIPIFLLFILAGFSSCKKDPGTISTVGSLNIINATTDISNLALNFSGTPFQYAANQTFISGQSAMEFGLPQGASTLNLISQADTNHTVFHGTLNVITGGIYSFYLAGQAAHYDTLMMKDNIISYPDSASGARFINLCQDSKPLNISLQGNTTNDFAGLAYKKITAFKKYPATAGVLNNGGYNYNITDAAGDVLATFNWTPTTFRENTLVITGLVANGSVSVFAVNNF